MSHTQSALRLQTTRKKAHISCFHFIRDGIGIYSRLSKRCERYYLNWRRHNLAYFSSSLAITVVDLRHQASTLLNGEHHRIAAVWFSIIHPQKRNINFLFYAPTSTFSLTTHWENVCDSFISSFIRIFPVCRKIARREGKTAIEKKVELDRVRMMKNFYSSFGSVFMFLVLPAGKEIDFDENNKKNFLHVSSLLFSAFHLFDDDKSDFHIQFSCHLVATLVYAFLPPPPSHRMEPISLWINISLLPSSSAIEVVLSPPYISPSLSCV